MKRYKHMNLNLLFDEMLDDINYLKKNTTFIELKKNNL